MYLPMVIPTKRFWVLVGLGVPLALVGAVVPGAESILIPYNIGLVAALLATAWLARRSTKVVLARRFDQVLSVRVPNRISITLTNESGRPLVGRLVDGRPEVFEGDEPQFEVAIGSDRSQTFDYHVVPRLRGLEQFSDPQLRVVAPLGLAEVQQTIPGEQEVRVYPNVLALREFDLLKQRGKLAQMGIRKARIKGQGTEFESLRDYRDDDFRRIDWKSTARKNRLVVRDFETERNQPVIVALDIGRQMLTEVDGVSKLDLALDACLMLLHAAATEGDLVGLLVYSDRVHRFVPPRKGRAQSGAILDAIHDLVAEPVESNHAEAFSYLASRWKRRSLMVLFTDAEDTDQAQAVARGISALRRQHLVMVTRVRDPKIRAMEGIAVNNAKDLYRKSAALWYQTERKRASTALTLSGVQNIDSDPQDLAQSLVSAYLVVKETAAL